jgi:class 3 adenylate cyclase/tetratricopeptide (TPR) repeat protein
MDRMRRWLEDLALGQHAEAFADNDIDLEVLPELGDQDLKDLGLSLGHRKKLLKAIAALAETEAPLATSAAPRGGAERRQLTVMFVDLVGSTPLSARLDPEDMREVIRAYQDACAGLITRFEGFVAKFMGDGVLAYFGYPRAHEDEAERAVRAGLALIEAVRGLSTPAGELLAARIGIATGLVVVGDLVGEGASQEQAVVGDTPNLAARLQGVAQPGQVVIAGATRRLLGARFALEDLGPQVLKGLAEPAEAFAVTGERAAQSRFEAHRGQVLPMVGRDQELALLLERWTQAKAGEGQGVLLVGEAGIGKSRITRALLDAVADEPHTAVRYQCSPYHADSAFWPVIQQLAHAAGLGQNDPLETKLDKLEALLAWAGGHDAAPLIADLLGLDAATRYGKLDLTPQAQRARTLDALIDQLIGLAAKQPVLVVLEDAHWIDPTTLELIEQCLDRIADARVLILLTSRPDNQPKLAGHPHVTRFTLNRLGHAGIEAIVARLGGERLPAETIDAIIARADGVPLFVEELTKAVLETGETTIPASLYDSLMARLDRIPEVKEVAQTAACIGRVFDYALLAAIADRPEGELGSALDKLAAAELIFRRGDARYAFKHALVCDAAYQSLLKPTRQSVHGRIAAELQRRDPEPTRLAHHLAQAGAHEAAMRAYRAAGELAFERSANAEAIANLRRSLLLLELADTLENRKREEIHLQLALGKATIAAVSYASSDAWEAFERARILCEEESDSTGRLMALTGCFMFHLNRTEFDAAKDVAAELERSGRQVGDLPVTILGLRSLAVCAIYTGEFALGRQYTMDMLGLVGDVDRTTFAFTYGIDPIMASLVWLAMDCFILGFPDTGKAWLDEGLAYAANIAHLHSRSFSLIIASFFHHLNVDLKSMSAALNAVEELSREHGFRYMTSMASMLQGLVSVHAGAGPEALRVAEAGYAAWEATESRLMRSYFCSVLAEAHAALGDREKAITLLDRGLRHVDRTNERIYESDLWRRRAALLRDGGDRRGAEANLFTALEVARRQDARMWELRAATSLARLWAEQDERHKANDLLTPIYAWFTEGFDTADLKDAKALLDELGAT